jgi:hypothetical protein
MDIDEEFDALRLPRAKKSLAWEARAKITWGDPGREVRMWLVDNGIDRFTAKRIVAIAVRERAMAIRVKGIRDLVMGIVLGVGGAAIGLSAVMMGKLGLIGFRLRWLVVLGTMSVIALLFGVHLTWRGLARIIGGARTKGAVSDVGD